MLADTDGHLDTLISSRRYKEDIRDRASASRSVLQLRPVTFRYRKPFDDGSKPLQYGLIAEEVEQIMPQLVVRNNDGQIESVQYHILPVLLLNELQRQEKELRTQEKELARLSTENVRLQTRLVAENADLKARLERMEKLVLQLAADRASQPATAQLAALE